MPAKSSFSITRSFLCFKDALDAADTKRFPESKYGPVLDRRRYQIIQERLKKRKQNQSKQEKRKMKMTVKTWEPLSQL
jgi:hypothetical protein